MNWQNQFSVGHQNIDNHHEELFQLVSALDTAIQTGEEEPVDTIISFLEHYVVDHFKEEEDLMIKHAFKGYNRHKAEHEKFKCLVKDIRENFNYNKSLTHIIFDIRRLIDTLVNHIQTIDVAIGSLTGKTHE
jgi:hemerythrin-like metal-binding protein